MKKLILTALAIGIATALQPAAHAQFGSGIVYDPTQSAHAVVQIEHEEQSISNQFQQIEQGQQIFSNTVKIATTALQAYNVAKQQYNLVHQMILAPSMLYRGSCLPPPTFGCCNRSRTLTATRWDGSIRRTPAPGPQPPTSRSACRIPTT
jgi:hypothetical protein